MNDFAMGILVVGFLLCTFWKRGSSVSSKIVGFAVFVAMRLMTMP